MLSVLWQHLKELLCGCSSKTANICETVLLHWVAVRRWFTTTSTMMRKQEEVSILFVYFSVYWLVLLWETKRLEKTPKCRLQASHGAPFWGAVRPCLSNPTGLISATKGSGQHLIWRGQKKVTLHQKKVKCKWSGRSARELGINWQKRREEPGLFGPNQRWLWIRLAPSVYPIAVQSGIKRLDGAGATWLAC